MTDKFVATEAGTHKMSDVEEQKTRQMPVDKPVTVWDPATAPFSLPPRAPVLEATQGLQKLLELNKTRVGYLRHIFAARRHVLNAFGHDLPSKKEYMTDDAYNRIHSLMQTIDEIEQEMRKDIAGKAPQLRDSW